MKVVQETTEWNGTAANNLYLVTDNMEYIVAYVPEGSKLAQRFKSPIRWDHRGRKFRILKEIAEKAESDTRTVEGSNGRRYTLTRADGTWSCTCPGYAYRGQCRHVNEQVQNM